MILALVTTKEKIMFFSCFCSELTVANTCFFSDSPMSQLGTGGCPGEDDEHDRGGTSTGGATKLSIRAFQSLVWPQWKTRSSWLNCALRSCDEAVYWVSKGNYEAVKVDDTGSVEGINAFIYCTKRRSGQVLPMPHSLTDWQLWKIGLLSSL